MNILLLMDCFVKHLFYHYQKNNYFCRLKEICTDNGCYKNNFMAKISVKDTEITS